MFNSFRAAVLKAENDCISDWENPGKNLRSCRLIDAGDPTAEKKYIKAVI